MRRSLCICFLALSLLCAAYQVYGFFGSDILGAASRAQGYSGITRFTDALSVRNNPALLALPGSGGIGLDFCRPSGLRSLDRFSGALGYRLIPGYGLGIGLSAVISGDSLWRESDFGLSISFAPVSTLAIGCTGRILHLAIEGICGIAQPGVDIGLVYAPLPALRLAAAAYSLSQTRMGIADADRVESVFRAAGAYEPVKGFVLGIGFQLDGFGLSTSFSSEYAISPGLALRASWETAPGIMSLGLGYRHKRLQLDIASRLPLHGGNPEHEITIGWAWERADTFGDLASAPVNINTANEREIASLPGMSARLAERILRERAARKFYSMDALFRVSGFTYKVMQKIGKQIIVDDECGTYIPIKSENGAISHINGYGIRELAARGIPADTARRIVILRSRLRGFSRIEDLLLMPENETNWIPLVLERMP